MSWFRSSTTTVAASPNEKISLAEALKALDTKARSISCNKSEGPQDRSRFSQLLLEHGEKHLQDWAVVASSSVITTLSKESAASGSPSKKRYNESETQWAQSAFVHSSSSLVGGNSRKSSQPSGKRIGSNHDKAGIDNKSSTTAGNMGKIEGRLHLCTNSILFEPDDTSRGIVRCPFSRMKSPPVQDKSTIDFQCSRHSVMKANNVVGPCDSIQIPVRFRFHFVHSSPEKFIWTTENLFRIVKGGKQSASFLTPEIDEIMKPMLDRPFDTDNLFDVRESILTSTLRCSLLSPLQSKPGCAVVTSERIYFQPASGVLIPTATKAMSWGQIDVIATARRYSGLRDSAVEIYYENGTSVLLAFERKREREQVMRLLPKIALCFTDREFVVEVEREWQLGNISNYDYLLALNSAAGRSFHDLSRYPVFPWVIADYQSSKLKLTEESTFRDLSKPVGALDKERLEYFQKRLLGMQDMEQPFLYGTHYSAPGYVLYFLVRSMPEHMLCLQNGKFDAPDRMFHSMEACYSCALSNHADVKELTPEFYNPTSGFDFLINARGLQLGATQNGDRVHDVALPPWAKSPRDFLKKNRKALESDICTDKLPRWIDLIFGCKSRGESATEASNLFHHTAYLGAGDLDEMASEEERYHAELQATEFGIVPDMLFCGPHPLREDPVRSDEFVASNSGRPSFDGEDDEEKGREELHPSDQQAWEILDRPSQDSVDELRPRNEVDPAEGRYVETSNGTKALTLSTNSLKSNQPLATPTGKAKASWVSSSDNVHSNDGANGGFSDKSGINGVARNQANELLSRNEPRKPGEERAQAITPRDGDYSQKHDMNNSAKSWDMKIIARNRMHGDTVSGCALVFEPGNVALPYLTTVSLDCRLMVHTVALAAHGVEEQRKNILTGTLSRFAQMGINRDPDSQNTQNKLNSYRSHSASDPLACLALTSDGNGGHVAFAGGHDDVVLAYGINSGCAVASVYSHRDAVTGLDLIQRNPLGATSAFWSDKATHIMVSGSWDATVKVWSVAVSAGETVSINREPLAELFDADSSIVCLSATEVYGTGIAICAGCSDGSFVAWVYHDDGMREVIQKDPARKGAGSCSAVKWVKEGGETFLFTCFSSGKVASYALIDRKLRSVSAVSLGVPVSCLASSESVLLVGCRDGGLRMLSIRRGAFVSKPTLWNAVNGKSAPGLTCVSIIFSGTEGRCICSVGAEDGSMVVFEINRVK